MKKPSKKIDPVLLAHFAEDRVNFAKSDERSARFELLLGQMGEHLSFLRRDMNVITETQKQHAEESSIFRKDIMEAIKEIKTATDPLVKQDTEEKIFDARITKWGESSVSIIKGLLAIGAACTMIWAVFKYIIFQAIK